MEDKSQTIQTLTLEEGQAVKRLQEVHGQIADGLVRLKKINDKMPSLYADKKAEEERAIGDALDAARGLFDRCNAYYEQISSFANQVNETMGKISELAGSVEAVATFYETASDNLIRRVNEVTAREKALELKVMSEEKRLDARGKGLDALNANIIKRAGEVQSRVDALKTNMKQ